MSRTLTASDRSALIRLASTLPAGSEERKAILAGLSKKARGYPRTDAEVFAYAGKEPQYYVRMLDKVLKQLQELDAFPGQIGLMKAKASRPLFELLQEIRQYDPRT